MRNNGEQGQPRPFKAFRPGVFLTRQREVRKAATMTLHIVRVYGVVSLHTVCYSHTNTVKYWEMWLKLPEVSDAK